METIFAESGPRSALALPPRTLLHRTYEIGRVLGKGGFGITYAAIDQNLQVPVAIKEYLPAQVAGRGTDRSTVQPHSGGEDDVFQHGLDAFLSEAQTLAQFDHPNIVRVKAFFRENGTGYLVMPFYEGQTLDAYLHAQPGPMPHDEAMDMIAPVLDGLAAVHERGILHRDIKPQNVYLTDSGGTVLLDFGAARIAFGEESQSLSAVLTPGYAPFEQYSRRGHQGPWTDVYATAAMMYRMVTGDKPPEATDRLAGEPLPPPHLANPSLTPAFSDAISTALGVQPKDRPQTIEAFRQSLAGGDATVVAGGETVRVGNDETIVHSDGDTFVLPHAERKEAPAGSVLILEAARDVRCTLDGGEAIVLSSGESREVPVTPGTHRLALSFSGVSRTVAVRVSPGERRTLPLDLPSRPPRRSRPPVGREKKPAGALPWVIGLGAALVGVVFIVGVVVAIGAMGGADADGEEIQRLGQFDDVEVPDEPIPPVDDLDLAIQEVEAAIRAEIAAEGGIQPTSGIEPIRFGGLGVPADVSGRLAAGDGTLAEGEFADLYMFEITDADYLFAELVSGDFDAYLLLMAPDGSVVIEVDDASASDRNAYLDTPLPGPGIYRLFVTSAFPGETGDYMLTVTPDYVP